MFHDPNNDLPILPEFWLERALEMLDRMEATGGLAPGVGPTARMLLCGLESRDIPPAQLDLIEHKTEENKCIVRIRWGNAKGALLTFVVVEKGKFFYRLYDPTFMDTGRIFVDADQINAFRWLVRKIFPGINVVKVSERKQWWA